MKAILNKNSSFINGTPLKVLNGKVVPVRLYMDGMLMVEPLKQEEI